MKNYSFVVKKWISQAWWVSLGLVDFPRIENCFFTRPREITLDISKAWLYMECSKIKRSTQNPSGTSLSRPCRTFLDPLLGMLDFTGVAGGAQVPPASLAWCLETEQCQKFCQLGLFPIFLFFNSPCFCSKYKMFITCVLIKYRSTCLPVHLAAAS